MILSDRTIKRMIEENKLIENPEDIENCLQPGSYDIRLGNQFKSIKPNEDEIIDNHLIIDPKNDIRYKTVSLKEDQFFLLPSKTFVLAVTKEIINLPKDISAFVEGRSSIGRMGLFIQNAGWIDSGFRGTITLELFNATDYDIKIYPNMRIGQIVFCKNDEECLNPYNGKYQNQIETTGSEINKDKENE